MILRSYWSGASQGDRVPRDPMFYIGVYAAVSIPGPESILDRSPVRR